MIFWYFLYFDVVEKLVATLYSNIWKEILVKYFASWYDAVPMMDIIGHNGRLLIVPISDISFYLVVP